MAISKSKNYLNHSKIIFDNIQSLLEEKNLLYSSVEQYERIRLEGEGDNTVISKSFLLFITETKEDRSFEKRFTIKITIDFRKGEVYFKGGNNSRPGYDYSCFINHNIKMYVRINSAFGYILGYEPTPVTSEEAYLRNRNEYISMFIDKLVELQNQE